MLFLLILCECGTGEGGGDGRNFAAGYGRPGRGSAGGGAVPPRLPAYRDASS